MTPEQIRENAYKLQEKGAPPEKIREYVRLAAAELKQGGLTPGTVQKVAKPAPSPSTFRKMLPTKEELPELGASIFSGIKTARSATFPGAMISGAASTLAEIGRQGLEAGGVFDTPPPRTFGESMKRQGAAFLRGAGSEVVSRGVGKLFSPFSGSAVKESSRQAAESAGIEAPLSNLSESKTVQTLERGLEYFPFGGKISKQRQAALEAYQEFTSKVGGKIAGDQPAEMQGTLAKEAAQGFRDKFFDMKNKLYDEVFPKVKDAPVDLKNTVSTLEDIIGRRSGTGEPAGLKKIQKWLSELKSTKANLATLSGGSSPDITTFAELRKFRTNVNSISKFDDPAASGLSADLLNLGEAISKDLDASAAKFSPELAGKLKEADAFFAEGKKVLKDKLYKGFASVGQSNVYKVAIPPKSPETIRMSKEILGDSFNDVAKQWFDGIVETSKTKGTDTVSPAKLHSKLKQYGSSIDEIAKDIPGLKEEFGKLMEVSELLTKGRDVTQGSQTGYIYGLIGSAITTITSVLQNPSQGLKTLGGAAVGLGAIGAGTAAFTSRAGREYLTRGFPKAGLAAQMFSKPATQLGTMGFLRARE